MRKLIDEEDVTANGCMDDGDFALLLAATHNQIIAVQWLVEKQADVDQCEAAGGHSPLHLAAMEGHVDVVGYLLDRGANPNCRNKKGQPPLFLAAQAGMLTSVKALLAAKADLTARDHNSNSALIMASHGNHDSVCHMLARMGSDPGHVNGFQNTAVSLGRTSVREAMAKGLEKRLVAREEVVEELLTNSGLGDCTDEALDIVLDLILSLDQDWPCPIQPSDGTELACTGLMDREAEDDGEEDEGQDAAVAGGKVPDAIELLVHM